MRGAYGSSGEGGGVGGGRGKEGRGFQSPPKGQTKEDNDGVVDVVCLVGFWSFGAAMRRGGWEPTGGESTGLDLEGTGLVR